MGNFFKNPLFSAATQALQSMARKEFLAGKFGQLLQAVAGGRSTGRVAKAARSSKALPETLRRLQGTPFGGIVREVQKYSRGGGNPLDQRAIQEFLDQLGPVGHLIRTLAAPQAGSGQAQQRQEVRLAGDLIRALGGESLLPPDLSTVADRQRGMAAARKYLEKHGFAIFGPGERIQQLPGTPLRTVQPQKGRKTVDVPLASGGSRRFPPNHPVVTGDMVPVSSSNVHSYGYDIDAATLYVRFLASTRASQGGNALSTRSGSPGSLYAYYNVSPELFVALHAAASKGEWVWDNLRIRGTVSGHQVDYSLVGVRNGYVPRKATMTPRGEAFIPREVRGDNGQWLRSSRGFEYANAGHYQNGQPDRGEPDRGTPDRGRP